MQRAEAGSWPNGRGAEVRASGPDQRARGLHVSFMPVSERFVSDGGCDRQKRAQGGARMIYGKRRYGNTREGEKAVEAWSFRGGA